MSRPIEPVTSKRIARFARTTLAPICRSGSTPSWIDWAWAGTTGVTSIRALKATAEALLSQEGREIRSLCFMVRLSSDSPVTRP